MHTDFMTGGDGQRTQVGPDPLDYVLRYSACDYDCYHQGRYIGSRATLPKAVNAVEHEQAKAAHHPHPLPTTDTAIAAYQDELRAIAVRVQDFAGRLAIHPAEHALMRTHLTLVHIRIATALRSVQDAECSLALAQCPPAADATLDVAA
ncbi:MAG: hypothetical protein ABI901_18380 [Roseiflexaceae bacterium]